MTKTRQIGKTNIALAKAFHDVVFNKNFKTIFVIPNHCSVDAVKNVIFRWVEGMRSFLDIDARLNIHGHVNIIDGFITIDLPNGSNLAVTPERNPSCMRGIRHDSVYVDAY